MSQIKPWTRVTCTITLAAFSMGTLMPREALADLPQQQDTTRIVDQIKSGIRLAQSTHEGRDVADFVNEGLSDPDMAGIVSVLSRLDTSTLPSITVQGSTIRFGKPADEIPELKIIDAKAGIFRFGKKEIIVRDGMNFEEFYSQFQANLSNDARTTLTSFLWSLFIEKAHAEVDLSDVKVVPDALPPRGDAPVKKGLSNGTKIGIAIAIVAVVALIAYLLFRANKNKKAKDAQAVKDRQTAREKRKATWDTSGTTPANGTAADAAYTTSKKGYDATRSEYEERCGSFPANYQLSVIAPDSLSQADKIKAMDTARTTLVDAPCSSRTSSTPKTTSH
ncbi:MAG: hypothetical protein ABIR96_05275 [Bdellovibrionota bacterium]